ncbi:MAG TPA: Lrp/AsnC family transcriptional regulator [Candidatus Pygmaiobacter gallistercoris]|nr:Lrp/AsnC family transcriptional regulator [Candidatus Pygmaiobacter gallistercoris]
MDRILRILEDNARLSLEDIAAMTDKTPQEVAAAIDGYAKEGIIKGYKTLIDWDKTDFVRVRALIELRVSPKKDHGFDEIASTIARFPEVDSVMLMSGGYDLGLVMTGKSFQEIAMFVALRLSPLDDVLSTATHFVLRTYKKDGVIFVDENSKDERGYNFL